ncbi:MAG: rod shape-determining protein RodA [Actinobacteria bacterium]|nr:rod shape-determining protein RodA [Actinomycetota bacterium]MBV8396527.1 rod shape-determining protein RodA [Actinomycetota bacterium]MBV8598334.1 rod shape-determining protein RodA [Actinomycetota bacterium]
MTIEAVDTRARGLRPRRETDTVGVVGFARRIDWLLLGAVVAIVAYGLRAIDGITKHNVGGSLAGRQALYAGVGAVLLVVATLIDPAFYRRVKSVIYGGTLGVMALVLVASAATHGSHRWINLGFFQFQPSEFGKVFFTLFIAGFLADRAKRIDDASVPLAAVALGFVPIVLVFAEPDVGTALVYSAALLAVLFTIGVRWLHLGVIAAVGLLGVLAVLWWLPAAGVNVLKPYQAQRLTGFTHPSSDPRGATYNVEQSIIAVGDGGLRGRGVGGSTQVKLDYLPANDTDFAFSSLAEERGFVGAAFLLLLYLFVVWRGLKIVTGAADLYSAAVAGGLVFAFLFQIYVNVGMAIGLAPITGIPLPLVSVGGSSMITNLLAVGILQSIRVRGGRRR